MGGKSSSSSSKSTSASTQNLNAQGNTAPLSVPSVDIKGGKNSRSAVNLDIDQSKWYDFTEEYSLSQQTVSDSGNTNNSNNSSLLNDYSNTSSSLTNNTSSSSVFDFVDSSNRSTNNSSAFDFLDSSNRSTNNSSAFDFADSSNRSTNNDTNNSQTDSNNWDWNETNNITKTDFGAINGALSLSKDALGYYEKVNSRGINALVSANGGILEFAAGAIGQVGEAMRSDDVNSYNNLIKWIALGGVALIVAGVIKK